MHLNLNTIVSITEPQQSNKAGIAYSCEIMSGTGFTYDRIE